MKSNADLPKIVPTCGAASGFSGLLDGWQQQGDQDGNDGDDDEKFN
jgi:hypothetical protein